MNVIEAGTGDRWFLQHLVLIMFTMRCGALPIITRAQKSAAHRHGLFFFAWRFLFGLFIAWPNWYASLLCNQFWKSLCKIVSTGNIRVITCEQGQNNTQHIIEKSWQTKISCLCDGHIRCGVTFNLAHWLFGIIAQARNFHCCGRFDHFQRSCVVSQKRWAPHRGRK